MSSTKPIPIPMDIGRCDVTIAWATGWKFTAKGHCKGIFFGAIDANAVGHAKLGSLYDCKFYPPAKDEDIQACYNERQG